MVGWRCGKLAGGGAWHVSANEELVPSDLNGGGPTLVRAVGRALEEELGLQIPTCWEGALGVLSTQLSRSAA